MTSGYCMYCGTPLGTGNPDGMCDICRESSKKGACNPVAAGWECPRCGKILAPWMPYCDCPAIVETTTSNNSGWSTEGEE